MGRTINIIEKTIVIQEEITHTGTEITDIIITLDDGGCVLASWKFGAKQYNNICLWDENTTPTYEEIGVWTDEDVDSRIIELL